MVVSWRRIYKKNVDSAVVRYSVLSMFVMYSWFIVLPHLVFELSKNGTTLNVAILASLFSTGPLHLLFLQPGTLIPQATHDFSLISVSFLPICHFIRKTFLDKISRSNIFSVFLSFFVFYITHLSLHTNIEYIYLSVSSTLLFTAISPSISSKIVKQVFGYGSLEQSSWLEIEIWESSA